VHFYTEDLGLFRQLLQELRKRKRGWSTTAFSFPLNTFSYMKEEPSFKAEDFLYYENGITVCNKAKRWAICLGRSLTPDNGNGKLILSVLQLKGDEKWNPTMLGAKLAKERGLGNALLFRRLGGELLVPPESKWLDPMQKALPVEALRASDEGLRLARVYNLEKKEIDVVIEMLAKSIRTVLGISLR